MKKRFCLLLPGVLLCLLIAPLFAAGADVIAPEDFPPYNEFYEDHLDECTPVDKAYTVKPEEVDVDWTPGGGDRLATLPGGQEKYVIATYDDGDTLWALVETAAQTIPGEEELAFIGGPLAGWLPMSELEPVPAASSSPEESSSQGEELRQGGDMRTILLIAVLVVAVVVVAVLLILFLGKRKNKGA